MKKKLLLLLAIALFTSSIGINPIQPIQPIEPIQALGFEDIPPEVIGA